MPEASAVNSCPPADLTGDAPKPLDQKVELGKDRLSHRPGFVRTCLHLAFRAQRLGYDVNIECAFCGGVYVYLERLLLSLSDELPACPPWPSLVEVLAGPAPRGFWELIAQEFQRYLDEPEGAE